MAKAAMRAAHRLGITNKLLARIIGLSEASVSRMKKGEYPLESGQKPFELAVLFVRLYRSLDALVGGDDAVAREWLRNHNVALKGQPIELIESVSGLANVIQYLDARRALV
jgi:hypothetical protein